MSECNHANLLTCNIHHCITCAESECNVLRKENNTLKADLEGMQGYLDLEHSSWTGDIDNLYKAMCFYKSRAAKYRELLKTVDAWFERMKTDRYEKLVHNQTLETASENWDKLLQEPLDMGPIKEALKENSNAQKQREGLSDPNRSNGEAEA